MITPSGCWMREGHVCIFNVQTRTFPMPLTPRPIAGLLASRQRPPRPARIRMHDWPCRHHRQTVESLFRSSKLTRRAAPVRGRETLLVGIDRDRTPLGERGFCHPLWPFRRQRD